MKQLAIALLVVLVGSCSLPAAGPTARQIETSVGPAPDTYLVHVTPAVMRVLAGDQGTGFPQAFQFAQFQTSVSLQPGDVIAVSIFEAGGTPLFGGGGRAP